MKISEYPAADKMADDDNFIIDGPRGTKRITKDKVITEIEDYPKTILSNNGDHVVITGPNGTRLIPPSGLFDNDIYHFYDAMKIPWQVRRTIYRGKNLGNILTDYEKSCISDGSFKGLFIGDYWEDYNRLRKYRIVDFNRYVPTDGTSSSNIEKQVVIMPEKSTFSMRFPSYAWNTYTHEGFHRLIGKYLTDEDNLQTITQIDKSFIENIIEVYYPTQNELTVDEIGTDDRGNSYHITSSVNDVKSKVFIPGLDCFFGEYYIPFPNDFVSALNDPHYTLKYNAYTTGKLALYDYYSKMATPRRIETSSRGDNKYTMPYMAPLESDVMNKSQCLCIDDYNVCTWEPLEDNKTDLYFRPIFCIGG